MSKCLELMHIRQAFIASGFIYGYVFVFYITPDNYTGSVAYRIRRLPCNPKAVGSIPGLGTFIFLLDVISTFYFFYPFLP